MGPISQRGLRLLTNYQLSHLSKTNLSCISNLLDQSGQRFASSSSRSIRDATQTTPSNASYHSTAINAPIPEDLPMRRPLKYASTPALLRAILLSKVFTIPAVSNAGLRLLGWIANSRHPLLDPDRNWFMNRILRGIIYNQFCGGTRQAEVVKTVDGMKQAGFGGVIIQYAREIVSHGITEADSGVDTSNKQIDSWVDGNLKSLACIGKDDYIGIKFTGAGSSIAEALREDRDPSVYFAEALDRICQQAKSQGSRILVDAEQQVFQGKIDCWAVDLMRKYNRDGHVLILNTYQAYLKSSRETVRQHLKLAQVEGWALGVKLVRGAYILNEMRNRIHDTKADTDASYDGIARDLVSRSYDDITTEQFPNVRVLLAGHNPESIDKAAALCRDLSLNGRKCPELDFGQLMGMADHISGDLLEKIDQFHVRADGAGAAEGKDLQQRITPRVVKCVNWGTVRECLHFLMRRAAENQGATDRLHDGLETSKQELKARWFGFSR